MEDSKTQYINYVAIVLIALGIPYIPIFYFLNLFQQAFFVVPTVLLFGVAILLNRLKWHRVAGLSLILSTSVALIYFGSVLGKQCGAQYLYFAMAVLPASFFKSQDRVSRGLGYLIPIGCFFGLEWIGFSYIHPIVLNLGYFKFIQFTIAMTAFLIIMASIHLFSKMAMDSEQDLLEKNKELSMAFEELKEKKRMDAELLAAAEIQRSALPQSPPKIKGFVVEDWFVPARGVSGDYFDYVDISATKTGFLIADITGKGIPAALMMMNLRSLWQSFDASVGTPSEILTQLNTLLYYHPTIQKQVPLIYGVLDVESRVFTYCNAGHEPGLHVHENNAEELKVSGPALGVEATIVLEDHTIVLSENDRLLLFTDGVTDIKNPKKNKFGHVALMEMIFTLTVSLPETDFLESFKENLMVFMGHEPQADDITLLSISANRR